MTAERLQRVAASAASLQAVQEALTTAFPPSQGSAKRAEKLKQFFSNVMPAGSGFKVRDPCAWQFSRADKLKSCLASVQQLLWHLTALVFGTINSKCAAASVAFNCVSFWDHQQHEALLGIRQSHAHQKMHMSAKYGQPA